LTAAECASLSALETQIHYASKSMEMKMKMKMKMKEKIL